MRVSGDDNSREDTSTATYAGAIVIVAILALVAIRNGFVGKG